MLISLRSPNVLFSVRLDYNSTVCCLSRIFTWQQQASFRQMLLYASDLQANVQVRRIYIPGLTQLVFDATCLSSGHTKKLDI